MPYRTSPTINVALIGLPFPMLAISVAAGRHTQFRFVCCDGTRSCSFAIAPSNASLPSSASEHPAGRQLMGLGFRSGIGRPEIPLDGFEMVADALQVPHYLVFAFGVVSRRRFLAAMAFIDPRVGRWHRKVGRRGLRRDGRLSAGRKCQKDGKFTCVEQRA